MLQRQQRAGIKLGGASSFSLGVGGRVRSMILLFTASQLAKHTSATPAATPERFQPLWHRAEIRIKSLILFDNLWCCRRGLNSRPLPYQGSALPLSYGSLWPLSTQQRHIGWRCGLEGLLKPADTATRLHMGQAGMGQAGSRARCCWAHMIWGWLQRSLKLLRTAIDARNGWTDEFQRWHQETRASKARFAACRAVSR